MWRCGSYSKPSSKKYQYWQTSPSFDAFVLLTSLRSKISILSYSSIYTSYKHSSRKKCRYYLSSSSKADLTTIVRLRSFGILFKGKLSSELNLVFMISPGLPPFILLTRYLILSQKLCIFFQYFFVFVCSTKN